jgi:hypothetical protein
MCAPYRGSKSPTVEDRAEKQWALWRPGRALVDGLPPASAAILLGSVPFGIAEDDPGPQCASGCSPMDRPVGS